MSYKSILAVVRVGQEDNDLQDAIELCREVDAHLSVVVVQLAPPPPMGDAGIVAAVWVDERQDEQAKVDAYVTGVATRLSATGISYSLEGRFIETAIAGDELGKRARYSDLTLMGAGLKLDPDLKSRAVEGCLFNSARPILFAPNTGKMSLRPKNVIVAWDSSLEAALAVRAALDFISQAEIVRIVLVDPKADVDQSGQEPGADVACYLARHSRVVGVDRLTSMGRPVAEVIQQHAVDMAADMIVMGAYGHSRIRERIFGGVTRSMIEGSAVPVFMIH